MDTVDKLSFYAQKTGYAIQLMGVPKTIDNDLYCTDHTPGFGSAAKYIATTMQEIARDCAVYKVKAVTIVEIMGRDAGWLTAAAGLPRLLGSETADLIYLPEAVFDYEDFISSVKQLLDKKPNVVVAVSEGIRDKAGRYVGEGLQSGAVDIFGHKYLAGTARVLEGFIKEQLGCKVRSVELSLPQRCAAHCLSATDIYCLLYTSQHGFLHDEDGNTVDDVVVAVYRAPHSYTGEDVVEISCHGSVYLLHKVMKLLIAGGARQAGNGEFSKRAFLNGKMDIVQAESVIDLIESESEKEAKIALSQLKGSLSKEIEEIRQELLGVSAQILAYVDYPDDEIEQAGTEELILVMQRNYEKVRKLEQSFDTGKVIKNGLKACLLGKPNAGKSMIMNRILGYERSIVTEIAGTTRDIVEDTRCV